MIIRVQSISGTKRIETNLNDTLKSLAKKIESAFSIPSGSESNLTLYKDRSKSVSISLTPTKTVKDAGLKHGDMLYISWLNDKSNHATTSSSLDHSSTIKVSTSSTSPVPSTSSSHNHVKMDTNDQSVVTVVDKSSYDNGKMVKEDAVDTQLWNDKGLIERGKDEKFCHHGPKAKCVHCTPLEPYDEAYMKEHNIKHMSFHSYLRKMCAGIDRGKFAALENISCKIKEGCKGHLPWPAGICTKCQPNAITLTRQVYRHIDNVVFENAKIVERFLDYWRLTGHQRIGFLYGYYEAHKDVPLGIKTTVCAIYEPPQETGRDYVKLQWPEPNQSEVDSIAAKLGLQRVGWIFTDLIPDDVVKGTVKHLRSADTFFLSAQECILAGHFQNVYPNSCRLSTQGYFGSKFVTVCVTGDKDNQIHMEGYQVSNQCMALVRDSCLLPTRDAPELAYVCETTKQQYVPDVFFTEKDKFGNEIKKVARTLPVEYLLIDVPVSAPVEPKFTFNPLQDKQPFPVENRSIQGHIQDFNALTRYLNQFAKTQFLEAAQDFHFILYIATMDMLPLKGSIDPLLDAIKNKNRQKAIEWTSNEEWQTVEQLIAAQSSSSAMDISPSTSNNASRNEASSSNANDDVTIIWSCSYCTYENSNGSVNCEMCGLPRHSG